jgi:arylsulfatase A-like enzyme
VGRAALAALACLLAAPAACGDPEARRETRPGHGPAAVRAGAQPVVLFVLIDALRRDRLSVYGHDRPTSPTLDRLAGEGLFLANLIVHSSQTVPSTLSILASQLPHEHGVQYVPETRSFAGAPSGIPRVPPDLALLPEVLARAGFFTAGIVANPWLKGEYGFDRGYAEYRVLDSRDGAEINAAAARLLAEHAGEKIFLYLHYMDVHNPYTGASRGRAFARPARGRYVYRNGLVPDLSPDDLEFTKALYDERVRYADGHVAELLERAREAGVDGDLTLVVTSDHGDEFHEHGGLGHGTTLYNELVRSFALIWNPARLAPRRVDGYLPALDLAPTLLDVLGLPAPPTMRGRPLPPEAGPAPRPIHVELADRKAVLLGRWKLHLDLTTGREQLYDVGEDAGIEDRPQREPQVQAELRAELEPLLRADRAPGEVVPIDPETARQLRALGYLDAPP